MRLKPAFKCQECLVLIFTPAAGEKFSERAAGEQGKGQVGFRADVRILPKVVDGQGLPVVMPDFWHIQGGVDWELRERFMVHVHLNYNIGRWSLVKSSCFLPPIEAALG